METAGVTPSPYTTSPSLSELLFKAAGSALGPIAAQRSNTTHGALLRAGAGLLGGLSGGIGDELAAQRNNPLVLQGKMANAGVQAANQVRVPIAGMPSNPLAPMPQFGALPSETGGEIGPRMEAGNFYSGAPDVSGMTFSLPTPGSGPTLAGTNIPISRNPYTMNELMRHATPEQAKAIALAHTVGKVPENAFFDQRKLMAGKNPVVDITDPGAPHVVYPGDPSATTEQEFANRGAKLAANLYKKPDDPNAQLQLLYYNRARASDPYAQEYYDAKIREVRAQVAQTDPKAPPFMPKTSNALESVQERRTQGAVDRARRIEEEKYKVQASPEARVAQSNLAAGREEGKLSVESRPDYIAAKEALVAAQQRAERENAPLSAGDRARFSMYESIQDRLVTIKKMYNPRFFGSVGATVFGNELSSAVKDEMKAANEGKYIPGRLAARFREYFGTLPPEQAAVYQAVLDLQDLVLRARSGGQTSEKEADRLLGTIPNVNDSPTAFETKYENLSKRVLVEQKAMFDAATKSARDLGRSIEKRSPITLVPQRLPAPPVQQQAPAAPNGWRIIQPAR